ncbi:hypothetical protein G9C85_00200 [Halorubellus sp. JP-L1]|uniref:hypothetical protein n=1 Tax=Halorubellus sp. JP-L1 TaxID=2715753 RepID=UPI00140965E0|nr:hypothetical protein [Halorubellus sp. JP-L1]NHN40059.1 hypothetical protein [Halorubellus sp. JP-L1]
MTGRNHPPARGNDPAVASDDELARERREETTFDDLDVQEGRADVIDYGDVPTDVVDEQPAQPDRPLRHVRPDLETGADGGRA